MASIIDDDRIGKEKKDRGNRKEMGNEEREAIDDIILGQGDGRGRVGLLWVSVCREYPFGVNQWCLWLFLVNWSQLGKHFLAPIMAYGQRNGFREWESSRLSRNKVNGSFCRGIWRCGVYKSEGTGTDYNFNCKEFWWARNAKSARRSINDTGNVNKEIVWTVIQWMGVTWDKRISLSHLQRFHSLLFLFFLWWYNCDYRMLICVCVSKRWDCGCLHRTWSYTVRVG